MTKVALVLPVLGGGLLLTSGVFAYRYWRAQARLNAIRSGQAKLDQAWANIQALTTNPAKPGWMW